jgi:undecaprenyl-diphosphatase
VSGVEAFILGLIQGVTEFLPVSSSGHLVVLQAALGAEQQGILFEITVHVATLASVLIFYRQRIGMLIAGAFRRNPEALVYVVKLAVATLPAVLLVLIAGDFLTAQFESPFAAGIGFLVTASVLWTTRWTISDAQLATPSWKAALLIGCAQAIAILPGISRSGSTVAAALALGVAPAAAAEFSFLMSVFAIGGAAVLAISDLSFAAPGLVAPLAVAGGAAFVFGVAAIWLFVQLLKTRVFHYFAYYTAAAGIAVLVWQVFVGNP